MGENTYDLNILQLIIIAFDFLIFFFSDMWHIAPCTVIFLVLHFDTILITRFLCMFFLFLVLRISSINISS